MAICLLHSTQTESLCPCSSNYRKGEALAQSLQKHNISLTDFWAFLRKSNDIYDYDVKDNIEFCSDHTLVAREMVSSNIWSDLYLILEQYNESTKKKEHTFSFDF